MAPAFPADDQSSVWACFSVWALPYCLQFFQDVFCFQSQPRFSEGRLGMWVSGENRSAQGGVDHGPGPCLLLFCLTEQTAVGKKRRELRNEGTHQGTVRSSPWLVGWPRRRRYTGSPFFFHPRFVLCCQNGGSRTPPPPPSHRQSFTNSHPCNTSAG